MRRSPLSLLFLLVLSLVTGLVLSGIVGCGNSEGGGGSSSSGSSDAGSGSSTSTSAKCSGATDTSVSADTSATLSANWNQSISVKGEVATTTSRDITLVLSATNSLGVVGYYLSETNSTPAVDDSGWVDVDETTELELSAVSFQLSATNGEKKVYGWFKDACGNISAVSSVTITLDAATSASGGGTTTGSGSTVETLSGSLSLPASTTSLTVSVSLSGSGTTPLTHYYLSESNSEPAASSSLWVPIATPSTSVSFSVNFALSATSGIHTVYGWLKSQSGRITTVFSGSTTLNISSLTAAITINSGGTFTTSRTVSLNLSGLGPNNITGYVVTEESRVPGLESNVWIAIASPSSTFDLRPVTFDLSSGDGTKTIYLHLKDSNNATASASASITLDTAVPTGTLKLDNGAKLTVDAEVSANITGSDGIGVVGYYLSSSSTVPGANDTGWTAITSTTSLTTAPNRTLTGTLKGLKTQYLWLKDGAGNVSNTISDSIEVLAIYRQPLSADAGQYSSIAVDSNNNPFISNYRASGSSGRLNLAYFSNGQILSDPIDQSGNVGAGTSIAVAPNGSLHIAYRDTTNGKLKYAYSTNGGTSWTIDSTLNEAGGISPSIAVDSNGKVHISHKSTGKIRHVTNLSGSWVSSVAIDVGALSEFSSLAIAPNGSVHIVSSASGVYHSTNESGSWQQELVRSGGFLGTVFFGETNVVNIVFEDGARPAVAENNGGGWSFTQIDTVSSGYEAGAMDSQGFFHVVYYDVTDDVFKYASNFTGSWLAMTLDSNGNVGDFCDIVIDSNDRLHISYYDATNGDLKYATTAD